MKQVIKLNESELKNIIKNILKEVGDTSKGQMALGALHARNVLRTDGKNEREFLDGLSKNNTIYDIAKDRRSRFGDDFDNWGRVKNPMYNDYAKGYIEYRDAHPDEVAGYDERFEKARYNQDMPDNLKLSEAVSRVIRKYLK